MRVDNLEVWTAALVAANCDSSSPGQSFIKKNWKRTGAEPAGERHRAFEMNGLTPDIAAAEVVRHGVLRLTFADGLSGEVDI